MLLSFELQQPENARTTLILMEINYSGLLTECLPC